MQRAPTRRVSPPAPDGRRLQSNADASRPPGLGGDRDRTGKATPRHSFTETGGTWPTLCSHSTQANTEHTARSWPSSDRRQGPRPRQPDERPACHLDTPCLCEVFAPLTQAPAAPQNLHLEAPPPTSPTRGFPQAPVETPTPSTHPASLSSRGQRPGSAERIHCTGHSPHKETSPTKAGPRLSRPHQSPD